MKKHSWLWLTRTTARLPGRHRAAAREASPSVTQPAPKRDVQPQQQQLYVLWQSKPLISGSQALAWASVGAGRLAAHVHGRVARPPAQSS